MVIFRSYLCEQKSIFKKTFSYGVMKNQNETILGKDVKNRQLEETLEMR